MGRGSGMAIARARGGSRYDDDDIFNTVLVQVPDGVVAELKCRMDERDRYFAATITERVV